MTRFKAGDAVRRRLHGRLLPALQAVRRGLEQYCDEGSTYTYNANDRRDAMPTYGGYSDKIVVTKISCSRFRRAST